MANTFIVTGNLGRDSELRTTQGGKSVLNFSLANTTGYGDHEKTNWVRCALFGDRADKLHQYLLKGTKLLVIGEFTTSKWTDKEGNERENWEMFVKDLDFMGGKASSNETPAAVGDEINNQPDLDDSIPF